MKMKKVLCYILIAIMYVMAFSPYIRDYTTEAKENKEDHFYAICNVAGSVKNDDITTLIVELPNGTLRLYEVEDAPIGEISECTLEITSEYAEDWEVVAIK